VRRQKATGDIDTVGKFNDYRSRAEAINAIREINRAGLPDASSKSSGKLEFVHVD
jgi:hypothetical protein